MLIKNQFSEMLAEMVEIRRDFHKHPELMYDVHRTAGKVAHLLRSYGCDAVMEGIGKTGVIGVIEGRSNQSGRNIGLRADMDALPIYEQTNLDYASTVLGKMHACGHDGHTTMLLSAARHLAQTRNFDGRAIIIFQPAEEGGAGGRAMVEDGIMSRFAIDEIYAMHNLPGLDVGKFAIRSGPIMAAADEFKVEITGKGGHAASPHKCIDAVVVASHIVVALQSIVSRNINPLSQAVVSVSRIETDSSAHNVLPQLVTMTGTVRTMANDVQEQVLTHLKALVEGIAKSFGATAVLHYHKGYPVTVNAAKETGYAAAVARAISGDGSVDDDCNPLMAAEDFSFMLNERPGAYIFLGNGDSANLHHPAYDFNDDAIAYGASWYAGMVEARLSMT